MKADPFKGTSIGQLLRAVTDLEEGPIVDLMMRIAVQMGGVPIPLRPGQLPPEGPSANVVAFDSGRQIAE